MTRIQRARGALIGAALLAIVSCGSSTSDGASDDAPPIKSSPFVLDQIPAGFELAAAGAGSAEQMWGEDSGGTDEPYTVLERAAGNQSVRVAKAGYVGTQGGFPQAANGSSDPPIESTEIDGKPALFWPGKRADDDLRVGWRGWPQLAVDEGNDLAVTVSGDGLSRSELEAVYRSVDASGGHEVAPKVVDPPAGFRVVGSVGA